MLNFIIGPIVKLLLKRTPSLARPYAEKIAKVILTVVLITLSIIAFFVIDYFNDRDAVSDYKKDAVIKEQAETMESNNRANRGEAVRSDNRDSAEDQSREILEDIHEEDPESAQAPATRGNRAVADRLR